MSIHVIGIIGLVVVFVVGTTRSVNLGAVALVMTFIVGSIFQGESLDDMYSGFPADLFVLLVGVTYLFGVAVTNGTAERIVDWAASLVGGRRAAVPWVIFLVSALPTMAGALGPVGVALLAPIALRLGGRYDLDRRLVALMCIYGSGFGNFSPLNGLGAIVNGSVERNDLEVSASALFFGNALYNLALAAIIYVVFGGWQLLRERRGDQPVREEEEIRIEGDPGEWGPPQIATLAAIIGVAAAALVFELDIGFLALGAALGLQLLFPGATSGADRRIVWGVVLLICGVVTYVTALQRYGTVDALGNSIADLDEPLLVAFLLCAVGAVTSAVASSAAILGALIPLAVPLLVQGELGVTAVVVALAVSATVVDCTPFSTVGALVLANTDEGDRPRVYRTMIGWGGLMVVSAPIATFLVFIAPFS
jgi:di/tricarboxylate transporter